MMGTDVQVVGRNRIGQKVNQDAVTAYIAIEIFIITNHIKVKVCQPCTHNLEFPVTVSIIVHLKVHSSHLEVHSSIKATSFEWFASKKLRDTALVSITPV